MADATYQPKVYKTQGGAELVVTSSGTLTLEGRVDMASGSSMTVASGAGISLASGSSFSCATDLEIASGGSLTIKSGGTLDVQAGSAFKVPVQTVSSSATTIAASGLSLVTGTTAGPTYLIANPITGGLKFLSLVTASTAATNRAIIAPGSTGVSVATSGQHVITLSTSALKHVTLIGVSTAAYRVFGTYTSTMTAGISNTAT